MLNRGFFAPPTSARDAKNQARGGENISSTVLTIIDPIYLMKKEALRRSYSLQTIKTYSECVKNFFKFCRKEPRKITKRDIKDYIDRLVDKKCSGSTINVNLNALKFLMQEILNKKVMIKIRYSKRPKSLPVVLSKEEVNRLIEVIKNPKHKLMIKLLYSAGLRVSELVNLKVGDLEIDKSFGWVRQGKGRKDRLFIIAQTIKDELKEHIRGLDINSYVFIGRNGHITARTIQEIIKKARKKAKISKNAHPHTLRHCLHPETRVINNGKILSAEKAMKGSIASFNFKNMKSINGRIIAKETHRSSNLISLWADGYEICCSDKHKFFALNQTGIIEIEANKLKEGDYIAGIKKINIIPEETKTKNFWRFAGYALGDAAFSKRRRGIIICDKEKSIINFYSRIVKTEFNKQVKISKCSDRESYQLALYSVSILSRMEELNLNRPSRLRRVPLELMNNSEENVCQFIAGLYDAEGNNGAIKFFSASKDMLKDVQMLLLRIGIDSHLNQRDRKVKLPSKKIIDHTLFVLNILHKPDQEKFIKYIPTLKKNLKSIPDYHGEKIPAQKLIKKIYKKYITNRNRWEGFISAGFNKLGIKHMSRYCNNISPVKETLGKIIAVFDKIDNSQELDLLKKIYKSKNLKWLKIKKIKSMKFKENLIDFTVIPTHCLITDGIISHNSFATHLIENGYGVSSVQSLLGHASSQTTMVYVHMASPEMINVKSPLDN
jgi:site-specific recombinase XerD